MGNVEETARLTVEASEKGVADVDAKIAKLERQIEKLKNQVAKPIEKSSGSDFYEFADGVYELADAYQTLTPKITAVVTTASKIPAAFDWTKVVNPPIRQLSKDFDLASLSMGQVAGAAPGVSRGTRDMGFAALQASRGIEDMQYGFAGVINNIPGVVMAMGGPAGLTAAISLASVGVYQLAKHWSDIAGLFTAQNPVPELANDLKGLEKATNANEKALDDLRAKSSLSNDELERYNKLTKEALVLEDKKALAAEAKKIEETKGREQEERGKPFQDVVKEVGGGQALADVQKALVGRQGSFGAENDKNMAQQLLANAMQGRQNATDMLNEMFSQGHFRGTKFGQSFVDPGRKGQEEADKNWAKVQADAREKTKKDREAAEAREMERILDSGELAPVAPAPAAPVPIAEPPQPKETLEQKRKREKAEKEFDEQFEKARGAGFAQVDLGPKPVHEVIPGFEPDRQAAGAFPEPVAEPAAAVEPAKPAVPGRLEDLTKALIAEAETQKLGAGPMLDHVRDGIAKGLTEALKSRGIENPDRIEIGKKAADLADKAIDAHKKEVKTSEKVEDKAEKHQAALDLKFHADQEAAEAKRIVDRFGKQAVESFEQQIKASMLPAEQAAKQLVDTLTAQLTAARVRFPVANLAARDIAKRAGFEVEQSAALAGPQMDAATAKRVAEARAAAAKELNTPEGKKRQSQLMEGFAAANKKFRADRAKAQAAARVAARKAKLRLPSRGKAAAARPTPPKPPDQAALGKAVDVTAKTQDAIAAGQTIDHQLMTRLAVLERRTATIEGTNKSLMNRAMEQAPTASNSGGSIA